MVAVIWSTFCMMLKTQIINRLRVVPLSLSPSCVTRKIMRKKWPPPEFHATFFFLAVFVRVTHDGQSEDTIMYPGLSFHLQQSGWGQGRWGMGDGGSWPPIAEKERAQGMELEMHVKRAIVI